MAGARQYGTGVPASNGANVSYANNVRTGTKLYICTLSTVTSEGITGITDTHGNTWSEEIDSTIGACRIEIWSASNGTSGANAVATTWSAFTASSKRIWLVEVLPLGSMSAGASDTHDQAGAEDPMTLASITSGGKGIALLVAFTDTSHSFSAWTGAGIFLDMGGGSTSRGAIAVIDNGESLAPTMDNTGTETGESLLMAFYDSGGSGGGEHAYVIG